MSTPRVTTTYNGVIKSIVKADPTTALVSIKPDGGKPDVTIVTNSIVMDPHIPFHTPYAVGDRVSFTITTGPAGEVAGGLQKSVESISFDTGINSSS
ncbi:hypothetical protein [Pseudomonas hormoni]